MTGESADGRAGGLRARLAGEWAHAREEDTAGVRVYRPAGHRLPPSRWRDRLELRPDGAYVEYRLGPDDRPRRVHGRWAAGPGRAITLTPDDSTAARTLEVLEAGPDRLAVRAPRG